MNPCVACGPDLISNVVHGGMALSAVGLGCVFMWLLVNMLRTNSMYGIGYTFYWLSRVHVAVRQHRPVPMGR